MHFLDYLSKLIDKKDYQKSESKVKGKEETNKESKKAEKQLEEEKKIIANQKMDLKKGIFK